MSIADNIKAFRRKYGLTQRELAEVAGVTENAVSKWENGYAEPRMGAIERIASCYGIKKSALIEDDGIRSLGKQPTESVALAPDEAELVGLYRRMEPEQRTIMLGTARTFAYASGRDGAGTGRAEELAGVAAGKALT